MADLVDGIDIMGYNLQAVCCVVSSNIEVIAPMVVGSVGDEHVLMCDRAVGTLERECCLL